MKQKTIKFATAVTGSIEQTSETFVKASLFKRKHFKFNFQSRYNKRPN